MSRLPKRSNSLNIEVSSDMSVMAAGDKGMNTVKVLVQQRLQLKNRRYLLSLCCYLCFALSFAWRGMHSSQAMRLCIVFCLLWIFLYNWHAHNNVEFTEVPQNVHNLTCTNFVITILRPCKTKLVIFLAPWSNYTTTIKLFIIFLCQCLISWN